MKSLGYWDGHVGASQASGNGTRCMARNGVQVPTDMHLPQVSGPA